MPPKAVLPDQHDFVDFGGLGVRWKLEGADSAGRFSVVHHPMAPHALAAPLHRHHREDEYSYVIRGRLGALLGDDVVVADTGSWVCKPRNQWHTFWNPDDRPSEIIEIISPAGFENFFRELAGVWGKPDAFAKLNQKYELDMDLDSIPTLCTRFALSFPKM